ncbi:Fe-S cluster assembly protein SufD [Pontibacter chitinilyticus]|uniref:Fe-S cluster assembly protein SufD n=1 Tax=Pontibacter chitinilyticus TaxID=2674989 RepID=UPI00321B0382
MANQISIPLFQELLDGFEARRVLDRQTEPEFLLEARQEAIENFRKLGFPNTKVEDWKYTNLAPFLREDYATNLKAPVGTPLAEEAIHAADIEDMDCYKLTLLNGKLQESASDLDLPAFIAVRPMAAAVQDPTFQKYFGKSTNTAKHHFAALNTALFSDGLYIEIAANAQLDKPLHLVHTYATDTNVLVQPRHLIVVHRNASLRLVETVVSAHTEEKIFVNSHTEVALEENANMHHYMVQTAAPSLRLLQHTEVCQLRDSVYNNYTFSLPAAQLLRNNLHVNLADEHTESHLFGLYLAADHQLVDNHTFMNHQMPHCESNEIYKGVLLDNAVGVFNGKVFVQEDAQKTNAFQQNNNLLLSNKATINSKPQLEIYADDVKCSHGSTTGQLSQEAMFYLQSRGIGETTARAMLVSAFAYDVTEKIGIPALEAYINKVINQHIPASQELAKV